MKNDVDMHTYLLGKLGLKFIAVSTTTVIHSKGVWDEDEYFIKLFQWARTQPFWGHFKDEIIGVDDNVHGPLLWPISEAYIGGLFINELYDFLFLADLAHEGYTK